MTREKKKRNPRANCPICGKFLKTVKWYVDEMGGRFGRTERRGQALDYYCSHCRRYFLPFEVKGQNPKIGGNPMAKRRTTKILGLPIVPLAAIGGLIWWLVRKK